MSNQIEHEAEAANQQIFAAYIENLKGHVTQTIQENCAIRAELDYWKSRCTKLEAQTGTNKDQQP